MPNKNTNSTAIVLKYVLNKMGSPKAIASDDGPEWKGEFKNILQSEGIARIVLQHIYHALIDSQEQSKPCYLREYSILGNRGIYYYKML